MVQQLFSDIKNLQAEVKRLRGRLDAFSTGGQVISGTIIGGVQLPLPIEGGVIYGTTAPAWGRLSPPVTAGNDYALKYLDGDNAPSWQLDTGGSGGGDDVFIIGMAAML